MCTAYTCKLLGFDRSSTCTLCYKHGKTSSNNANTGLSTYTYTTFNVTVIKWRYYNRDTHTKGTMNQMYLIHLACPICCVFLRLRSNPVTALPFLH